LATQRQIIFAHMTPPSASALPPGLTASFETVRPLGAGGMGAVWLARDRFLDRLVALKVMHTDRSDSELRERFLREARTSARLEHPHIIDVYRADETDGVVWFSMRYVNGESLGDRLRERGKLSVAETVRILREVAWGLAYAHARGVVHRDVKPDNILLDRETGRAVVTDFGIARDMADASTLTLAGNVLGSVHYMSPEQASGEAVDARGDLYALGCVAWHMLAGAPPFDGSVQSVLVAHVTRPVPSLAAAAPTVPPALVSLIEQCLRKEPGDRPGTADLLASALDDLLREAEAREQAQADAAPGGVLSESQARLVWQRAAQLQAEAAHRMERNAMLQAPPAAARPETAADGGTADPDGFRVRDVEAAAVEAGISQQYVAIALAELRSRGDSGDVIMQVSEREDRRMTLLMGTADRAVSVSRVIPAAPKATLQALGAVFTSTPFEFTLQDTINGHPLDGGIMRFKVPRLRDAYANPLLAFSKERALRSRLEQIELFDVNVTLHARGTVEKPACEVVVTGDLRSGLRRHVKRDLIFMAGTSTAAFAGASTAIAAAIGVPILTAAPLLGAAGASVLTGATEGIWYRWLFRRAIGAAMGELQNLLCEVERHLTRQALFSGDSWRPPLPTATETDTLPTER
jgi:eukaryotic-like serine/threonine-protein kinase